MHRFERDPILDVAIISELQDLDQGSGFFAELVFEICKQNNGLVAKIQKDSIECEYDSMRFSLHTLKGSSLNVGAVRLGNLAREMEEACHRQDCAAIRAQLQTLVDTNAETVTSLRGLL